MDASQISLQLYTIREHMANDTLGTLEQVAAMGYRAVEPAGYGNATPATFRAKLDELGMRAPSVHVSLQNLLQSPEQTFADIQTLGCDYAIVPWVAEEYRNSTESIQRLAEHLNQLGQQAQAAGLRFGYHNHAFEFIPREGTTMWEQLMAATDPQLVCFELDIFWAKSAGADPLAVIQRDSGRLPLLHVKDMTNDNPPQDAPVGSGILPWDTLLPAGEAAGAVWYIVEQDHPRNPLSDVATSYTQLARLLTH